MITIIISLAFILSGFFGLIYEVLWVKYLGYLIGNTSTAITIVLTTFMLGMAGGSRYLGKWSDKVPNPLKLYALVELGIGIYGIGFPFIYQAGDAIFVALGQRLEVGSVSLWMWKLSLAFFLIILPSFLMGGTFPLMNQIVKSREGFTPEILGRIYFLNSMGGAIGALGASFFVIPEFGMNHTSIICGLGNVLIFLFFITLTMKYRIPRAASQRGEQDAGYKRQEAGGKRQKTKDKGQGKVRSSAISYIIPYFAVFTGAMALGWEVLWERLLVLVLGSSAHSFALMLATFILGLALGGLIAGKKFFARNAAGAVVIIQALLLLFLGIGQFLYGSLPYLFLVGKSVITPNALGFYVIESYAAILCMLVMLIPTILMGITFPLLCVIPQRGGIDLGRLTGKIYSANTLGCMMGGFIAGMFVLPWIGSKSLVVVLLVLQAVFVIVTSLLLLSQKKVWVFTFAGALSLAFLGVFGTTSWTLAQIDSGVFRVDMKSVPSSYQEWKQEVGNRKVLFHEESKGSTVKVIEVPRGNQNRPDITLHVNGKADASRFGDLPTELLSGQIPAIYRGKGGGTWLVVGLGSGITAGTILSWNPEHVDIAEINPGVVKASRFFEEDNHDVLKDPRVSLLREDGKTVLKLASHSYDIIISEPSNPWISGIGSLFSKEYMEAVRSHLTPDGIFAQWVQLYEFNDELFKLVLSTVASTFPHVALWNSASGDVIIIASPSPLKLSAEDVEEPFARPEVKRELARIGIRRPEHFLLHFGLDLQEIIPEFFDPEEIGTNSDFSCLLEYEAPKAFFIARPSKWLHNIMFILNLKPFRKQLVYQLYERSDRRNQAIQEYLLDLPEPLTVTQHPLVPSLMTSDRMENAIWQQGHAWAVLAMSSDPELKARIWEFLEIDALPSIRMPQPAPLSSAGLVSIYQSFKEGNIKAAEEKARSFLSADPPRIRVERDRAQYLLAAALKVQGKSLKGEALLRDFTYPETDLEKLGRLYRRELGKH